jgi:ABC-2 type transport system ATP-binding protein
LLLDEPTSGLDPIVRREFIETVIGAYLEGDPGQRTVFVSTHLISEFEGLIDEFTIIDAGRQLVTLDADVARERYRRVLASFVAAPPESVLAGIRVLRRRGREVELLAEGDSASLIERLRPHALETVSTESLSLEEIFVSTVKQEGAGA